MIILFNPSLKYDFKSHQIMIFFVSVFEKLRLIQLRSNCNDSVYCFVSISNYLVAYKDYNNKK